MKNISNLICPCLSTIFFCFFIYSPTPAALTPNLLWAKTYAAYDFQGIAKTTNGNYIAVGSKQINMAYRVWVVNLDTTGKLLWEKLYGPANDTVSCEATKIAALPDGGFIVGGNVNTMHNGDLSSSLLVLRLNSNGDTVWTFGFDKKDTLVEYLNSIVPAADGGFVVVGGFAYSETGNMHTFVFKLGPQGTTVWSHIFGDTLKERASQIVALSDSGFMVIGRIENRRTASLPFYSEDLRLLRLNQNGDTLWTKKMGVNSYQLLPKDMKITDDSGFVITGFTSDSSETLWVMKLNPSGDKEWMKKYCPYSSTDGFSVEITSDNGFIICGSVYIADNSGGVWLLRLNEKGDSVWTFKYGNKNGFTGYSIIHAEGNQYFISGAASNASLLMKIEEETLPNNIRPQYALMQNNQRLSDNVLNVVAFDLLGRAKGYLRNSKTKALYSNGMLLYKIGPNQYIKAMQLY